MQQQTEETQSAEQQIEALEGAVKKYLDADALVRFGTLKAGQPEIAQQLTVVLAQLVQQGRIRAPLTDAQLKTLLQQMTPEKKEFRITRK